MCIVHIIQCCNIVHILYTVQFQCTLSLSNTLTSPAFCAVHVHIMQCTTYCPYCSVHHWHHQPLRIAPRFAKHCSIMQCIICSAFSANIIAVRTQHLLCVELFNHTINLPSNPLCFMEALGDQELVNFGAAETKMGGKCLD